MEENNLAEFILGITNTPEEIETYKMYHELRKRGFSKKEFELLLNLSKTGFLRTVEEKINTIGFDHLLKEAIDSIEGSLESRDNNEYQSHLWGHLIYQYYKPLSFVKEGQDQVKNYTKAPMNFMAGCIIHILSNLYPRSLQSGFGFRVQRNTIKNIIQNLPTSDTKLKKVPKSFYNAWDKLVDYGVLRDLTQLKQDTKYQEDPNDYDVDPVKLYDFVESIDKVGFVELGGNKMTLHSLISDSPLYRRERNRRVKQMGIEKGKSNLNYNYPVKLQKDITSEKLAKDTMSSVSELIKNVKKK